MESQKQPMKAVDSLGQGFSDPPLINLPAVLSTDTHGHLCHWICPWASPVVPRAAVLLLSQIWMFLFFSHGSQHSRFPFWLSELSAVTACASCLHPQQHWRYQSNTPSAWEVYHYQLRRCRSSGNFNQQRHFHIQRDKDIINSLKWAPEEMSCSSWDSSFLHPVWNKLFHKMQWYRADPQLLMPWFFSHRCT